MKESLRQLHQILLNKGIAFVSYSLPGKTDAITLISYNPVSSKNFYNISDYQDDGFLFAPFITSDEDPIWFLKADELIDKTKDLQTLMAKLEVFPELKQKQGLDIKSTSKEEYSKAFDAFMLQLKSAALDKAILSRIVTKSRTKEEIHSIFCRLSKTYPSAFSYLISLPFGEIWMGATPELLLRSDSASFQTMALAGTQLLKNRKVEDIVWNQKEIKEQAYVSKYVENILTSISESLEVSDTYSIQAGNLVHLRTDFKVNQALDSARALNLAKQLHPTPAVCGIPLEKSRALILKTEKHKRAYYTGFLGPINKNAMSLFVNLRSMQLLPEKYVLYVGGGITRDSEKEKEWAETEAKAQTLLALINSSS